MTTYHFQTNDKALDCKVITDHVSNSTGANGSILEIRDDGATKLSNRLSKGVVVTEASLTDIATAVNCNLFRVTSGKGAAQTTVRAQA